jgi:hypothetical protein
MASTNYLLGRIEEGQVDSNFGQTARNITIIITNATSFEQHYDKSQFDAFLYIIVVLMFYACSLVILMIKYMKGEQNDARLSYYFEEFVKRENFQNQIRRDSVTKCKNIIMGQETCV